MAGFAIRLAGPGDEATIARLVDELNAEEGDPVGRFTADAVRREGFRKDPPEFRVLLAEEGGEPLGYALFHPAFVTERGLPGLYLYDLLVTRPARRRGIGRALVAALAALAKAESRPFLWWCSKPGNEGGRAFYAGLGAVEEEVRAHALSGDALERLADEARPCSAT